ncbi:MAG: lipoate-protein ligase B [Planctomycetota bacterium]|nr:MAG: lipoate-protein ligase B [Planctomycetota bacterium]
MSDPELSLPLTERRSDSLQVFLLGTVEFESALRLQEQFRDDVIQRDDRLGGLFVCEHPPVVTIGREGSQTHLRRDLAEFNKLGINVRWLNRGGGAWMQCPGQIAVYPIVPLRRLGLGLTEYRQRLELAVLDVCRELHVAAHRIDEEPGIFCSLGQLAAVGVAVRSWVTTHGLTLNVSPDLSLLRTTRPNSRGLRPTSLQAARQRLTAIPKVRESLIRNLTERLGYEQSHLYTSIPGLKRTKRRVFAGQLDQ